MYISCSLSLLLHVFFYQQIVVNALMNAIPAIINVLMVCMVFWLIFSILGVQLFKGKFYKCFDKDFQKLEANLYPSRSICCPNGNITADGEFKCNSDIDNHWRNSYINFDHVASGFLALFQVVINQ